MAEEIDDNEFFQQDFTTASEWEIFNARLDEIFHEWKLPYAKVGKPLKQNEIFLNSWDVITETIFFADIELSLKHYKLKIEGAGDCIDVKDEEILGDKGKLCQAHLDLMSLENNFCVLNSHSDKIHLITSWYGLREFVIIEPTGHPIINESQFRVLLSSACITVAESNTEIPVFIHVMPHDLHIYLGVCESPSMRVNFDIVALETIPPTCKYLSGLLCMFKGKIGLHYVNPVTVSVRLTYSLMEFLYANYFIKCKIPFSNDYDEDCDDVAPNSNKFYALPYGVTIDPVSELVLNCTWPEVAENVIVDSATYSDLDPILAPFWSVRANFNQQPLYFLTDAILEYEKLAENMKTLSNVLGSSYDLGSTQNFEGNNPLDLLTESKIPGMSSVLPIRVGIERKSKPKKYDGPIKEDELMQMLYYMFPDAQSDPKYPYELEAETEIFDPLRIKSAPADSLVFRLSTLLTTCNSYFGGVLALAHLWAEFTQEMRYRVERCIQIPG